MEPLRSDPARLRQVLVNLLENAVKYSPAASPIGVRVRDDDEWVRIEVTDVGPGIPLADQQRVFEKFSRLDPQMARGVGGSTDIVRKEMFTFEDKGGRSITLRPEATPRPRSNW